MARVRFSEARSSLRALTDSLSYDSNTSKRSSGARRTSVMMFAESLPWEDLEASDSDHDQAPQLQMQKRKSILTKRALIQLEQKQPGFSEWLSSWKGVSAQIGLIVLFLSFDVARPLMYKWAISGLAKTEQPITAVLTGLKNVIAILLSFTLAIFQDGREGVRQCLPSSDTFSLIPVATLSTAANILSVYAIAEIDPGTFKVLMQCSLVTTGLLSYLLLNRRYTCLQVQTLAFALMSVIAFAMSRAASIHASGKPSKERQQDANGLLLGASWTVCCLVCTSSNSVLGERFLKRDSRSYNSQKVHMEVAGLPISALVLAWDLWNGLQQGLFVGWRWRLSVALLQWVLAGWLTGLIVKQFSSLVKRLLQGGSAVLTYVFSIFAGWLQPTMLVSFNAVLVVQAIMLFFSTPALPVKRDVEPKPNKSVAQGVQLSHLQEQGSQRLSAH